VHREWEIPKGVRLDVPEYQLNELIKNGESETVEFKAKIGKREELIT
ncbi:unnamed protein product, partial [marine sediment metagenome]